jgi:hypothetical protein
MTTPTIIAKDGDTSPLQAVTLKGRDGTPADLTGATVVMQVDGQATSVACTVVDAAAGQVRPSRTNLPVPTALGRLIVKVEFEVTYADAVVQTFPESGYLHLQVYPDLD